MKQFSFTFLVLFFAVGVSAQDKKKAESKPIVPEKITLGRPVSFENDIRDILDFNCVACHNVGTPESKLNLEEVDTIVKGGKRGKGIVAGKPDESLVYLVASRAKQPHMPPLPNKVEAQALTPKELGLLRQWIVEGAKADGNATGPVVNWQPIPTSMKAIYSVALSPWGERVAVGRANQLHVYNVNNGSESRLLDPNLKGVKSGNALMYPTGAAHRDFVHSIAFHPNGRMLATGGFRVVKLWEQPSNVRLAQAAIGGAGLCSDAHAAKGLIAIGTQDNKIQIRSLVDGKLVKTLEGHAGPVKSVQFSKDGARLISGSDDKTVRVWSIDSGKVARTVTSAVAVSAVTFNAGESLLVSAHADKIIRTWNLAPPAANPEGGEKPIKELKGHTQPINSLAAISTGNLVVSGANDNTARIWNLDNGAATRTLNHGGPVVSIDVRPDGKIIATGSSVKTTKLWDATSGKQIVEIRGHFPTKRSEALALEEQSLADQLVKLADAAEKAADKNAKERAEALKKADEAKKKADTDQVTKKKAFDESKKKTDEAKKKSDAKPDDKGLKKAFDDANKDLTKKTDELKTAEETQKSAVRSLELAKKADEKAKQQLADTKQAHVKAKEHKAKTDEALKKAQEATKASEQAITAVAFSADNTQIAIGSADGTIQIWDAEKGIAIDVLSGPGKPIKSLAFADGNRLVSIGDDNNVAVWNTNPAWKLVASLGASKENPLDIAMSPFIFRVLSLAFSADGKYLATGGGDPSRSGEIVIWDVAKKEVVRKFDDAHSDTVFGLEFSRDGSKIVSGAADKFVKIHEVATGKHVKSFEGHTHHVLDVTWKADGSELASAGADNAIKIWNVETGEQRRTISNYSKQVTSIQYMGVSGNIISCSGDKQVKFHTTSNGSNFRSFSGGTDFMYASDATRDQKIVVAGGEDGVVRVWNGANGQVLRTFAPPAPPTANVQANAAK